MDGQPFLALPGATLMSPEKPLLLLVRGQVAARLTIPTLAVGLRGRP